MMLRHHNIHHCGWTSPDGKTHNADDHILRDRRWYSSIPLSNLSKKLTNATSQKVAGLIPDVIRFFQLI
jgi:hypothetical protein